MHFKDIPQFPKAHYNVSVDWGHLEAQLEELNAEGCLDLDPDFQRAHVWTEEQQIAYVEYVLRGGEVAKNLTFNAPGWPASHGVPIQLVDGKQRLEAARAFMRDDLKAFGHRYSEFEGRFRTIDIRFEFRICSLETREEVLQLYLNINAGGTPHSAEEIERVRAMLKEAK